MKESLSLEALAVELTRQREAKVDYLVPPERIHFVTGDGTSEVDLLGPLTPEYSQPYALGLTVGDHAHGQFAERLKIPKRFYDRLRGEIPTLLDANVNTLLRHRPDPDKPPPRWMIRTLDGVARAALSDQFRRIDNDAIAEAVLPLLQGLADVRSAHISEKFMHIKATTPRVTGNVKVGQDVCAGVCIRNSEVGAGMFTVFPFVETLQCENGMVVMRMGAGMMKQIHLGGRLEADGLGHVLSDETRIARDRAFMMTVRDVVRAAVDEARFSDLVADMARAADDEPVEDVQAAVEVLAKEEGLTEHEGRGVLTYLARGGDLSRWGMISAVTRLAEDADSYDRATELETLGGKVLDYSPRQWNRLVYAGEIPQVSSRERATIPA